MEKIFSGIVALAIGFATAVAAADTPEIIKLPYQSGERFVVVQGYDSPPTHIKKDYYALDLSQDGCDAYGKLAVAAFSGTVLLAQATGYNGGYGTQVLVKTAGGDGLVARYAHMIPGTIPASALAVGAAVVQGEPLGEIGNTGLVAGAACPEHPGTHLHFAIYGEESDGSFVAYKPEPISGYENIRAGNWYLSDNALAADSVSGLSAIIGQSVDGVLGDGIANVAVVGGTNGTAAATTTFPLQTIAPVFPAAPALLSSSVPESSPSSTTTSIFVVPQGGGGGVSASTPIDALPPDVIDAADSTSPSLLLQSSSAQFGPNSTASSTLAATSTASTAFAIPASSTTSSFDSSTLAIDLSWQPAQNASGSVSYEIFKTDPAGSTTLVMNASNTLSATAIGETSDTSFSYPLTPADFAAAAADTGADASGDDSFFVQSIDAAGNVSLPDPIDALVPKWFTTIQPLDNENSHGSWYDDNWYELGTGFYGTIRSLTLEGSVDNSYYFASHLWLKEYLDANYTELNQTYTISNNAPFTDTPAKITIGGLNIPLQPNKYYRLDTSQDYQNRSVILAGTSATGTAMYDVFDYGVGAVYYQYPFYPFLQAVIVPDYPPLLPPLPVATATIAFDSLNSVVTVSWQPTTDPDTTSSLLTYEVNDGSSTWQSVGKNLSASFPVAFGNSGNPGASGNSYLFGIRAVDDLGNISQPLFVPWNFPAGYAPPPVQLDHSAALPGGAQKITFAATTTVSGVALWTAPQGGGWCCSESFVSIHSDNGGTDDGSAIGAQLAASDPVRVYFYNGSGEEMYAFDTPVVLSPGAYWFSLDYGPTPLNGTSVYGSSGDSYSGGEWSTAPGQDAYFRIEEATEP